MPECFSSGSPGVFFWGKFLLRRTCILGYCYSSSLCFKPLPLNRGFEVVDRQIKWSVWCQHEPWAFFSVQTFTGLRSSWISLFSYINSRFHTPNIPWVVALSTVSLSLWMNKIFFALTVSLQNNIASKGCATSETEV